MGVPSEKVRELLDELGIKYETPTSRCTEAHVGGIRCTFYESDVKVDGWLRDKVFATTDWLTPEQAIAATIGVGPITKDSIRKMLDKFSEDLCTAGCGVECETFEERRRLIDATKDKHAQAIVATVGMEKWEPSKEWKAWYNSLKHDNPTSIREAVENILHEAIDFGGDMGPNGNVWSGVDEGTVLTENCIDGWVESVESIAATVGKGIEHYDGNRRRGTVAILQGGRKPEEVMFVGDEGSVTHYLPEGAGTCRMEVRDNLAETEGMGDVWLECDKCHWQMPLEPSTPRFRYCPNCKRRIVKEESA